MNFNFSKQLLRKDVLKVVLTGFSRPRVRGTDFENALTFYNLTTKDVYKNLLAAPVYIPKMDPQLVEAYLNVVKTRVTYCEPSIYPLYMRTPGMRLWYRFTWVFTLVSSIIAIQNVLYVVVNN